MNCSLIAIAMLFNYFIVFINILEKVQKSHV